MLLLVVATVMLVAGTIRVASSVALVVARAMLA
jgi:hypothetical protein